MDAIERSSVDDFETQEWCEALDDVLKSSGRARASRLLEALQSHASTRGVDVSTTLNTPYINTIPRDQQPPFPGSHDLERRIRNILRWNAIVMVVRANIEEPTIGGHIATYAS